MTKKAPGEITRGSYFGRRFSKVARSSGQRLRKGAAAERGPAALLHQSAANVVPSTLGPEQTTVITESGGVTFQSQLEARWAACFDWRGIAWEHEPAPFDAGLKTFAWSWTAWRCMPRSSR